MKFCRAVVVEGEWLAAGWELYRLSWQGVDLLKRGFNGCEGDINYLSGFKLFIIVSEARRYSLLVTKRVLILAIKAWVGVMR